ncbi:ABC transporter permease [Ferruginibacter sp.]|nr:FtsX-like permease family protein [Ferruginibacter sp.]
MVKNYFKIAFRNLWKHKLFSFVNIFGLALSMAVGVLIFARLKANYDTDHFHPKLNQIVRILTKETVEGRQALWATTPQPLAAAVANIPSIEKTVALRFGGKNNALTNNGEVPVDISFSEPSFFEVFGFKLLSGNAKGLADNPAAIFLSEQTAKKIFGKTDIIGQTVEFTNIGTFSVQGIIAEPALQTHLPVEAICSMLAVEVLEKKLALDNISNSWDDDKHAALYARLNAENNISLLNAALKNYSRKKGSVTMDFEAQRLEDITPRTLAIQNDNNSGINNTGIIILLFLILALTLLSAFNYVSLSMARALSRSHEIGVRKTIGASRWQIINQFLAEAVVISIIALLFSVPLVFFLMSKVDIINFVFRFDLLLVLGLLAYGLFTGLVAGALPAWLLSAFQPVQVLRKMKNIKLLRSAGVYKILIIIQFSVTIMLMIFFVILTDFEKKNSASVDAVIASNILTLDLNGENYENVSNEISHLSQVENVLATNWFYDSYKMGECSITWNNTAQQFKYVSIDPKTIRATGIKLKLGNNFPANVSKNTEQFVLLNEAAAKLFTPNAAIINGQNILLGTANVQVIGIMPDQIAGPPVPLVFRYLPKEVIALTIVVKAGNEAAVSKACTTIWKQYFPQKTPAIHRLRDKYTNEATAETMGFFAFFALLVMIIAAMGILGIASYAVELRTKELGIRKVLGANKIKLIWSVTKNFTLLILYAGFFGIPAGLFCGHLLQIRMGSKVDIGPVNLLIGFSLVAFAGIVTVLSQTIRAGLVDPVKVLKAE